LTPQTERICSLTWFNRKSIPHRLKKQMGFLIGDQTKEKIMSKMTNNKTQRMRNYFESIVHRRIADKDVVAIGASMLLLLLATGCASTKSYISSERQISGSGMATIRIHRVSSMFTGPETCYVYDTGDPNPNGCVEYAHGYLIDSSNSQIRRDFGEMVYAIKCNGQYVYVERSLRDSIDKYDPEEPTAETVKIPVGMKVFNWDLIGKDAKIAVRRQPAFVAGQLGSGGVMVWTRQPGVMKLEVNAIGGNGRPLIASTVQVEAGKTYEVKFNPLFGIKNFTVNVH
jgi:hypothetical protein